MNELDRAVAELLGRRIVPFVKENLDPGHDVPGVMHFDELTLVDDEGYLYVCDENHSYQDCDPENFTQLFSPSSCRNQAQAAIKEWCQFDLDRQDAVAGCFGSVWDSLTATPEQLCRALVNAAKEIER